MFSNAETKLSRAWFAGGEGRQPVQLLVVAGTDPWLAMVQDRAELHSSRIVTDTRPACRRTTGHACGTSMGCRCRRASRVLDQVGEEYVFSSGSSTRTRAGSDSHARPQAALFVRDHAGRVSGHDARRLQFSASALIATTDRSRDHQELHRFAGLLRSETTRVNSSVSAFENICSAHIVRPMPRR